MIGLKIGLEIGGFFSAESVVNEYYSDDALTEQYFVNDALTDYYQHESVGTVKLPADAVIAVFGDSLEQHHGTGVATAGSEEYSNSSRGALNWCRILDPRGRWSNWYDASKASKFFIGQNVGISGNETSQMEARIADFTNIRGLKLLIIGGGTNDLNASRTTAQIMADLTTCYEAATALGIKCIILTPPPRALTGTNSWASGSAIRLEWMSLCAAMQAYADADPTNFKIVRRDHICANEDADLSPIAGHLNADNVHLTPSGGYAVAIGKTGYTGLIDTIASLVDSYTPYFPAASVTGDLSPNPTMSGTAGTVSTGCTGTGADSFTIQRQSGSTGVTCVASKDGAAQKLVFTRDGTGGTVALFTVGRTITSPVPAVGKWYQGFMKFRANASSAFQQISLQTRSQPSSPSNSNHYAMKIGTGAPWPSVDLSASAGFWQACPPFKTKVGTTSVIFLCNITIDNATAGTDTIWIDRMQLIPIPDPVQQLGYE